MLTESELAVLNVLMYNDEFLTGYAGFNPPDGDRTLGGYIRSLGGGGAASLGYPDRDIEWVSESDWNDAVNSILGDANSCGVNGGLNDLSLLEVDSLHERGSRAACFVDADGQPYVVFKGTGTDPQNVGVEAGKRESEWSTNCEGLGLANTDPQIEARDFVDYCYYRTGRNVVVTGHSNGGNKAMYATVASGHVDRCVAFDGQGFSPEFLAAYADEIAASAPKITNICTEGDFVNVILASIAGDLRYVQATRLGGNLVESYAMNHSPVSVLGDDCRLGEEGDRSPAGQAIADFTTWLADHSTSQDRQAMGEFLGRITNALMGTKEETVQFVLADDPEGLGVLVAYLMEYPDLDDLVKTVLSELLAATEFSGGTTEEDLERISEIREVLDALVGLLTRTPMGVALLLVLLLGGGASLGASELIDFLEGLDSNPTAAILDLLAKLHLGRDYTGRLTSSVSATRKGFGARGGRGDGGGALASAMVRDFSDEKLEELLSIVREVRDEPWYDVSRWDVWYRCERFFGRLTIDNYQSDISTFYRKTIDAMDMSEAQVRDIFDAARTRDAEFGSSATLVASSLGSPMASLRSIQFGV